MQRASCSFRSVATSATMLGPGPLRHSPSSMVRPTCPLQATPSKKKVVALYAFGNIFISRRSPMADAVDQRSLRPNSMRCRASF